MCDIKRIIADYKAVRLTGKHNFVDVKKLTRNLYFTRAEASRIVRNALRQPTYKSLAVAMLIITGLRAGELLGLKTEDVYLDDGFLWIHQKENTKSYAIEDYIKENKSREVYLSQEAETVVRAALKLRETDESDSPYLLLNANATDGKMHIRAIDDYMREYVHKKVLGLGDEREARSPHDCRRTYATLEFLSGTPIGDIAAQLGHSTISQTERYIVEIVDANNRKSRLRGGGLVLDAFGRSETKEKEA